MTNIQNEVANLMAVLWEIYQNRGKTDYSLRYARVCKN